MKSQPIDWTLPIVCGEHLPPALQDGTLRWSFDLNSEDPQNPGATGRSLGGQQQHDVHVSGGRLVVWNRLGMPKNGWFRMENAVFDMDDWELPRNILGNLHISSHYGVNGLINCLYLLVASRKNNSLAVFSGVKVFGVHCASYSVFELWPTYNRGTPFVQLAYSMFINNSLTGMHILLYKTLLLQVIWPC